MCGHVSRLKCGGARSTHTHECMSRAPLSARLCAHEVLWACRFLIYGRLFLSRSFSTMFLFNFGSHSGFGILRHHPSQFKFGDGPIKTLARGKLCALPTSGCSSLVVASVPSVRRARGRMRTTGIPSARSSKCQSFLCLPCCLLASAHGAPTFAKLAGHKTAGGLATSPTSANSDSVRCGRHPRRCERSVR